MTGFSLSEIVANLSIREYTTLCSKIDKTRPQEKFNIIKIIKEEKKITVTLLFDKEIEVITI